MAKKKTSNNRITSVKKTAGKSALQKTSKGSKPASIPDLAQALEAHTKALSRHGAALEASTRAIQAFAAHHGIFNLAHTEGAVDGDELTGDGTWPFTARVDGNDIVVEDIVITCFGGAFDEGDDGDTASGISTKDNPDIQAVSVAMDGRQFPHMSAAEHARLDGCPLPRMPWFTQVEVTIEGQTLRPARGIIDLGPAKQASQPGEPHALDLTVAAAAFFEPGKTPKQLANGFEKRGSFRIIGGANFVNS